MSSMQLPAGLRPANPPGQGGGGGPSGQGGGGGDDAARQQQQAQEEEMRRSMISQVLEPEARERLSRISLVRPDTSRQIEDLLMRMARSGQLRGKVGDAELRGLLEQVSAAEQAKAAPQPTITNARTKSLGGGITIQRKRDDSDSDEYDL